MKVFNEAGDVVHDGSGVELLYRAPSEAEARRLLAQMIETTGASASTRRKWRKAVERAWLVAR